ncbi:MAG: Gldg family protein, partial [Anderseniella sp.]
AGTNSTDELEIIPFMALERQDFLELDLTQMIFKLANAGKKKIALMSRLPIVGNVNPQTGQAIPAWQVYNQLNEFFLVGNLGASFDNIPDEADLLLIVAPGEINEQTKYAIDQFALSGKPVIVFADPYSEVLPAGRDNLKTNKGFTDLLSGWGLRVEAEKVVGDIENSRQVQFADPGGNPSIVNYVTWLAMGEANFDRTDGIFNQVSSLLMASAGSLEAIPGSGLTFQPMVATSPRSSLVEIKKLRNPNPIKLLQEYLPDGQQRVLAARVRGDARSVFGETRPAGIKPDAEHRVTGAVNVLAVSDGDMLYDSFWAEVGQLPGGKTTVIPRAGNANFLINAISDMAGGQALAGLRGRGVEQRPFTRVAELRTAANARFRQQEQLLNDRLQETQKKLTDLLSRSKDGTVTLSEADQKAIEDFRTETFTVRKSLREVQRNLRSDIDALGVRIKMLNIAIVPLLVALFGFTLLWRRRSRAGAAKTRGASS